MDGEVTTEQLISTSPFETIEFAKNSPQKEALYSSMLDQVYKNKDKYHYRRLNDLDDYHTRDLSDEDDMVEAITHRDLPGVLNTLAMETDGQKVRTILGMCVDRDSLAYVADKVRNLLKVDGTDGAKRPNLEKMGKMLLGISPDDPRRFYAALEDLYANVDFEHYPTNNEATQREVAMFRNMLSAADIEHATVVDLGCGTGRIANELVKDEHIAKVIGVDPSTDNLEIARKLDTSGKVSYEEGSWNHNTLPRGEADATICIGRTLTHARDYHDLKRAFQEVNRTLKPGGSYIFDLPNNSAGVYLENRKRYIDIMKQLYIPVPKNDEILNIFERVVDSPDKGQSLFDRYVPNLDRVVHNFKGEDIDYKTQLGRETGFAIREYTRASIEGWEGAENIYYVATKPPKESS